MKFNQTIFILLAITIYSCSNQNSEEYLYPIKKDKKAGYIDSTGKEVIKPQYLFGSAFNEGLAMVTVDTIMVEIKSRKHFINDSIIKYKDFKRIIKYGYIDCKNNFVIKPTLIYKVPFDKNEQMNCNFYEGLAVYQNEHTLKYGYINKQGDTIIPAKFVTAAPFADSLGLVSIEDEKHSKKFGYINHNGQFVIEAKFDNAYDFSEGLAVGRYFWADKDWSTRIETIIINKKGNMVGRPLGMTRLSSFSEGYCIEYNEIFNAVKFIDKNGEDATDLLEDAGGFSEGLSPIKINGKWGFCDTKFKLIIPAIYNSVSYFSQGIAPAKKGGTWGYINKTGETIIPFKYDSCTSFDNSLAKFYFKQAGYNVNGYINRKGEIVWQKEKFEQLKPE